MVPLVCWLPPFLLPPLFPFPPTCLPSFFVFSSFPLFIHRYIASCTASKIHRRAAIFIFEMSRMVSGVCPVSILRDLHTHRGLSHSSTVSREPPAPRSNRRRVKGQLVMLRHAGGLSSPYTWFHVNGNYSNLHALLYNAESYVRKVKTSLNRKKRITNNWICDVADANRQSINCKFNGSFFSLTRH